MTNVAYAKRNIPLLKIRKFFYGLIKIWRIFNQIILNLPNDRVIKNIVIMVDAVNKLDLGDIINRIYWGFPENQNYRVKIKVIKKFSKINWIDIPIPTWQQSHLIETSHIEFISTISIMDILRADLILNTKFSKHLFYLLPYFIAKFEIADPLYYGWSEGNIWMKKFYFTKSKNERKHYDDISLNNFSNLRKTHLNTENAYCFLTGPSFDDYNKYTYDKNSLKIICNTIIKNKDFLNYIGKPDIVMFADCVFHFGPSKYASQFRARVVEVVNEYKCFVVVPKLTVPLLLAHHPFLKDYIIGLDVTEKYSFPSVDNLKVYGTKSISTYLMLPLASSLAKTIFFIGADGRKPDENYFWKHNPKVQFSDLMETVFLTHPSFFRDRDYSSDYEEYCYHFEELIKYGERKGKKYYSLTKSHIPALSNRYYK